MKKEIMKKITRFLLLIPVFPVVMANNFQEVEQKGERFVLRGKIKSLKDGTRLYLVQHSTKDTIATTKAEHEEFVLQGKVHKGTEYYYIRLDTAAAKQRSQELLLVNSDLVLKGQLADWPKVELLGSTPHDELQTLINIWDNSKQSIAKIKKEITQIPNKKDSLKQRIEYIERERLTAIKDFINSHLTSLYIPELILRMEGQINNREREEMFNNLSPSSKQSYFGEILASNIETIRIRKMIKPGSIIPNFGLVSTNNESLSIKEIASRNKLTLIDFWASWCKPCREQIPNLKNVYEVFNRKGFDIVGIAINEREGDWKKALEKDNTPWLNARDESKMVYNLFNVAQIPAYILIDDNGKIISFYCEGSDIDNFGPEIKGQALLSTVDSLLKGM